MTAAGLPRFRAAQLSRHYFTRFTTDAAEMTDLPAAERDAVVDAVLPTLLEPVRTLEGDHGNTVKNLWRLFDGSLVESVLMRYSDRTTLCLSSQAGCGMACPFCATGQQGLTRNLSTAEIVDQVVRASRAAGGRVTNVVFMGMGEPLANYGAVVGALRRMTDPTPDGLGISARNITVSTVGLVTAIEKLIDGAAARHARRQPPHPGRRAARHPRADQHPPQRRGAARRRPRVLRGHRSPGEHRVRPHPRHERPGVARRPARPASSTAAARAGCTSTPSRSTRRPARSGPRPTRRSSTSSSAGCAAAGIPTTVRDTRGRDIDGACGQLAAQDLVQPRQGATAAATTTTGPTGPSDQEGTTA